MPPSLTSRVEVTLSGTLTSSLDFADASFPVVLKRALDLINGTGAAQANVLFADQRTLAPSATENLDLIGGGLLDAYGNAIAPARLRAILAYAAPSNVNNITLFGNANHVPILNTPATTFTLRPNGLFLATFPDTAGAVVTAGTGDLITVTNAAGGTSVTYDIALIGASA